MIEQYKGILFILLALTVLCVCCGIWYLILTRTSRRQQRQHKRFERLKDYFPNARWLQDTTGFSEQGYEGEMKYRGERITLTYIPYIPRKLINNEENLREGPDRFYLRFDYKSDQSFLIEPVTSLMRLLTPVRRFFRPHFKDLPTVPDIGIDHTDHNVLANFSGGNENITLLSDQTLMNATFIQWVKRVQPLQALSAAINPDNVLVSFDAEKLLGENTQERINEALDFLLEIKNVRLEN